MYFLFCKQVVNPIHSFDNNMFNKFKKNKNKRKMSKYMLYLYSKVKEGSNNQLFLQIYEDKGGVKMKGNKRLLVLAVLLLLVTVTFTTYAIYRSSKTANGTLQAAAWSVKVKKTKDTGEAVAIDSADLTFTADDVNWTKNTSKVDGKVAPGSTGTISFTVDATGSEVDVVLSAALGTVTGLPNGMTVEVASGSAEQTIAYNASEMKATVTLNVTWEGTIDDSTTKDGTDKAAQGTQFTIPVTLTARQGL